MKKIAAIILIGVATLFFTGCGGGGGGTPAPAPAPETVNLIGTWNYEIYTTGGICDGLLANGIEIIEPLNGDTSLIGDILIQGTGFEADGNFNCYLADVDITTSAAAGLPSTGTVEGYIYVVEHTFYAGDNTIADFKIISFTNNKIVEEVEYTNGVVITSTLTRI